MFCYGNDSGGFFVLMSQYPLCADQSFGTGIIVVPVFEQAVDADFGRAMDEGAVFDIDADVGNPFPSVCRGLLPEEEQVAFLKMFEVRSDFNGFSGFGLLGSIPAQDDAVEEIAGL